MNVLIECKFYLATQANSTISKYIIVLLGSLCSVASADPIVIDRTVNVPIVDGNLDEPIWQVPANIQKLTQVHPNAGESASEDTEIWIRYDQDAIYFAVRAWFKNKENIFAKNLKRDYDLDSNSDDQIVLLLDPFGDYKTAFYFSVNPLGARSDALVENGKTLNYYWDGIWEVASKIEEKFWITEWRVPLNQLRYKRDQSTWAFNIERRLRHKNEIQRWKGYRSDLLIEDLSFAGMLQNITLDKPTGSSLSIIPSVLAKHESGDYGKASSFSPSLDSSWRITPSLNASLSLNTDFAEAETDDLQTNYTRFPIFEAERRKFFLDDSGYFGFSDFEEYPLPFFSRRIGLDEEGSPVDVELAMKLAGKVGQWSVGLLNVHTGANQTVEKKELNVVRISRQMNESSIGLIATRGDPRSNGSASLIGVDLNYINNKSTLRYAIRPWLMETNTSLVDSVGKAYGSSFEFPNEPWSAYVALEHYDTGFDPALGFNPRSGIRNYYAELYYILRPHAGTISSISIGEDGSIVEDLNENLDSYDVYLPSVKIDFDNDSYASFSLRNVHDVIYEPFELTKNIIINPAVYSSRRPTFEYGSASESPIRAEFYYSTGNYLGGKLKSYRISTILSPSKHWRFAIDYEVGRMSYVGAEEKVELTEIKIDWFASTKFSVNNSFQRNSEDGSNNFNIKLRYTFLNDNDLYVVFRKGYFTNYGMENPTLNARLKKHTTQQTFIAKLGWAYFF